MNPIACPNCHNPVRPGAKFCSNCGATLAQPLQPTPLRLNPGAVLQSRFRIEKILGEGGFGAVYLAQDTRLGRECVVKQMLIEPGATPQEIAELRQNFEREARSLVALNHPGHPNIPEIYDFFDDPS